MTGRIEAVNISGGGVPKSAVFEAFVSENGVSGDAQTDSYYHGGPDRAVVLFSLEAIRALQREGHPIAPGTVGENLTISGVDWPALVPGCTLRAGGVTLQVTKYATPCTKIAASFLGRNYMRVAHKQHEGWSRVCARVLEAGIVRPGDPVELLSAATLTSARAG